jgi:hypothetical protein
MQIHVFIACSNHMHFEKSIRIIEEALKKGNI